VSLDVSGLPLEDFQLCRLLRRLGRLEVINLEGCKKLTPLATRLMLGLARCSGADGRDVSGSGNGPAVRLRFVNAQRCFQLTAASLDDLLSMAQLPGSCLEGVAASHLNLEGGTCEGCGYLVGASCGGGCGAAARSRPPPLPCPPPRPSLCSLRAVVLTNSTLTVTALLALADACPDLEHLFLGGSTLKAASVPPAEVAPAAAAGDWAPDGAPQANGAGEAAAAEVAPGGGGGAAEAGAFAGGSQLSAESRLWQFERRLGLPLELPPLTCALDTPPVGSGGGEGREGVGGVLAAAAAAAAAAAGTAPPQPPPAVVAAAARARGLALAAAAAALPRLRVLEVTFFDGATRAWLDLALSAFHDLDHHSQQPGVGACARGGAVGKARPRRPEVWDLSDPASIQAAARALARAPPPGAAALAPALRAAVSCSSRGRATPLHVAAEAGRAATVRACLALGASVSAKDAAGQQPLFLACEAGHAAAAAALLRGGACATAAAARSGETPLYIAALKGG
jgi:hypothetical protein